jgi:hypothetical protein
MMGNPQVDGASHRLVMAMVPNQIIFKGTKKLKSGFGGKND